MIKPLFSGNRFGRRGAGVSQPQLRVNEAVKLGFETCILPQVCLKSIRKTDKINIIGVRNVSEAMKLI